MGLTLVKPDLRASLHVRVEDPLYDKERPLDAANLAQRNRQIVLTRIGSKLTQELARPDLACCHGGGTTKKVRSIRDDQFLADFTTHQLAQVFGCPGGVEHVQSLRRQVADAQDEAVAEHGAGPEQMIGEPGCVGILLTDLTADFIHQQTVKDIRRLADGSRIVCDANGANWSLTCV